MALCHLITSNHAVASILKMQNDLLSTYFVVFMNSKAKVTLQNVVASCFNYQGLYCPETNLHPWRYLKGSNSETSLLFTSTLIPPLIFLPHLINPI